MEIADYYEVISASDQVIHVQFKGFWPNDKIEEIHTGAMAVWKQAVDQQQGNKFIVLADFTACSVPSASQKRFMSDVMRYAKQHQLYKTVHFGMEALTRMGTNASARKAGLNDDRISVENLTEARTVIEELRKEL